MSLILPPDKEPTPREMSEAAVMTFVAGIIQITLTVLTLFLHYNLVEEIRSSLSTFFPDSRTRGLTALELNFLFLINGFSIFTLTTFIHAVVDFKRDKIGQGLATLGLVGSLGCLAVLGLFLILSQSTN